MNALSWWRSWHGAPTDPKWAVIAARSGVKTGIVSAVAWALLDYASQHRERGSIAGFDAEVYAVYSGFTEEEINAVIQAMTDKGIIIDGKFANWEKRQPKREDYSTERVRNYRAMKRNVTQSNAPEKEKETEEDADTDTEKEKKRGASPSFDDIQELMETSGVLINNAAAIRAVNDIIAMGAIDIDIRNGIKWKCDNSADKIVYASSLVGPTRTAMQKRLKSSNGHKSTHVFQEEF